ncbi:MAG TPA: rod shape-determining protein MreC [Anaerolineaceae bacterium]|nr:rod shape-determining protein MreC [Anaerolineaceae bacterium]
MKIPSSGFFRTIALGLVVVGLIGLALSGYLTPLFRATVNPLVSVQEWFSVRYMAIYELFTAPDVAALRQQNAQYEVEIARLQARVIELEQQLSEAEVVYKLLEYKTEHLENQTVTAGVIGRDPNPFLQYIIIDKGSDQGLRRGMPVVTEQGLVGRVEAVFASASRVQLITDASASVNVRLQNSETEAVLTGSITGDVTLDMIPQDAKIEVGDGIMTSGLGGNYPANVFVGQVSSVRSQENELFQQASVQPIVDFSTLKVVLVVTNFKPVDITPLIPTTTP